MQPHGTTNEPLKQCYLCKEHLPATPKFFQRDRGKTDGFRPRCKACEGKPRPIKYANLVCAECGKEFSRKLSQLSGEKEYYCGLRCAGLGYKRLYSGQNSVHYNSAEIECAQCGKNLIRKGSLLERRKHHFCDYFCMGQWRAQNLSGENSPHYNRVETRCRQCGKEFAVIPRAFNEHGNFCNAECFGEWLSENNTGENNPLWKGGKIFYHGPDWQRQRRKARKRDGYTCQSCHATEEDIKQQLDVHHKIPFREFGIEKHKEANRLSNLICLCRPCHIAEHIKARQV